MPLTLQFVGEIDSDPSLRLNLNSPPWTTLASTEFGMPEMRHTIAAGLGAGFVAAASPNLRVLHLRLQVKTATVDDTATQVQKLVRELDRPTNLLMTKMGTKPVFFRTFRSSPDSWDIPTGGELQNIAVDLLAEPYALGLLETVTGSPFTLNTDPALSNGNFIDATGIIGDADTPAIIRWPATAVAAGRESLFAVRRRGTPSAAPFIFQAENQTNGTDTADQANASFSNANGIRTTFGTASMTTRSTISDLGTAGVDLRGRYRVFARYAKTTSGDTILMRIQWGTSGGTVTTNDSFSAPTGTGIFMADLGEIQVPRGLDPVTADDGVEIPVSDTYHFAFQASRSGSGNLDTDHFIFVPADDRFTKVVWVEAGPSYWKLDARDNGAYAYNASDQLATAATPEVRTGLPMLTPNQTNRIYMVYEVAAGLATTLTTVAVTVQYHPRYATVRPALT